MKNNQPNSSSESFVEAGESQRMSNQELHDLVHNHQKFLQTVQRLNEQAELKINMGNSKEALIYLTQAQQILQYAASCGKNIDRQLIISVLHNEACANQKSWELLNCSNYLEALIYNMREYLKLEDTLKNKKYTTPFQSCSQNQIEKSMRLAKYHLQYAAINSQLKNHTDAHESSKKAISILQSLFKALGRTFRRQRQFDYGNQYETKMQTDIKYKILESLSSFNDSYNVKMIEDYIVSSEYFYQVWKINKTFNEDEVIQDFLRKFSIGSIMQIGCDSNEEDKTHEEENLYFDTSDSLFHSKKFDPKNQSYQKVLEKILIFSIAYFTTATELRLASHQKYRTNLEVWKSSPEYKESQIYHLFSLMIVFAYVPFQMHFISHIINSYYKNYSSDPNLFRENNSKMPEDKAENIILQIDPGYTHLEYKKKRQREDEEAKPVEVISKFAPRRNSRSQKSPGTLTKLQKKCRHIINKKYMTPRQNEFRKIESSNSLTYWKNKRTKTTKSDKSKKSFSISKKDNVSNYIKLQDYFLPGKRKKEKEEQVQDKSKKYKNHYEINMNNSKNGSTHRISTIKSLQSFHKKKEKEKSNCPNQSNMAKGTKKKKSVSKKKQIKGMKPMGSKKSEILKSLNKNPQIAPKKETEFTDYYD